MNNMLVTTDFSSSAQNAVIHTAKLARVFGVGLEVLHLFTAISGIGIDGCPDIIGAAIIEEGMKMQS